MTRLQPIQRILDGRLRVASVLGQDDLLELYEVRESNSGRPLLLEVVVSQAASDPGVFQRSVDQANAAASLPGGVFARVMEVGSDAAFGPFILREALPGPSIATIVSTAPLVPERVATLLEALGPAFDHAHSVGLVHGGLTPACVFCSPLGAARVAALGLGQLRRAHPAPWPGPVGWCSPEQAGGAAWTGSMDVYALALLAHFAMTGRHVLASCTGSTPPDPRAVWAELLAPPVPAMGLGPELDRAIAEALAPDPAARPPTVQAFAQRLRAALGGVRAGVSVAPQRALGGTVIMAHGPPRAEPSPAHPMPQPDPAISSAQPAPHAPAPPATQAAAAPFEAVGSHALPATAPSVAASNRSKRGALPLIAAAVALLGMLLVLGAAAAVLLVLRSRGHASREVPPSEIAPASPAASAVAPEASALAPAGSLAVPVESASAAPAAPARVIFSCDPPCERVTCEGTAIEPLDAGVELTPGEHTCELCRDGYTCRKETVVVSSGSAEVKRYTLEKAPTPPAAPATAAPTSGAPKADAPVRTSTPRPAGKPAAKEKCGTFINPCKKP